MVPALLVLVADAVPPVTVFDAVTQLGGTLIGLYPAIPDPPQGGGADDAGATRRVRVAVAVEAGYSESVTFTVNVLAVAVADGVPVMEPEGVRPNPVGSVPPESDQL